MRLKYTKTLKVALSCIGLMLSASVIAEPRTNPTTINNIRTLASGATLVTVQNRTLSNPGAGNFGVTECTNSSFVIAADGPASNNLLATALTAAASGSDVIVEISSNATSCGFGTEINSIFLVSQ